MRAPIATPLALLLTAVAGSSTALAFTDFTSSRSRPAAVSAWGIDRVLAVNSSGNVGWRPAGDGPWHRIASPANTLFYSDTGVASIAPPGSWGIGLGRAYAISQPYTSASGTTVPSQLWELNYDSYSSTDGTWRALGVPSGVDFSNAPAIAATYAPTLPFNAAPPSAWIAIRATDGSTWTCRMSSPTSGCLWENETFRGGSGHQARAGSPVAVNVGVDGDLGVYMVDTAGRVERYRWATDAWDTLPYPNGTFSAGEVDPTSIQVRTSSGLTRVYVAVWNHVQAGDALFVAQTAGSVWQWWRLRQPDGDPVNGIDWRLNNLSLWGAGSNEALWFVNVEGDRLYRCDVKLPLTGTGDQFCVDTNYPAPSYYAAPVEQLQGRDAMGPSVLATSNRVLVAGTLNGATYTYGLNTSATAPTLWSNLLAPRDSVGDLPSGGEAVEFAADEYHGLVVATSAASYSTPDFPRHWISTDDGSTWTRRDAFSADDGDPNVAIDGSGNVFVTGPFRHPDNTKSVRIARMTSGGWSTPMTVPTTVAGSGGNVADRPWLTADRTRTNVLFMTWSAGAGANQGHISYCSGGRDCATDPLAWCTATTADWNLPSGNGCAGNTLTGAPGCWIEQSGGPSPRMWLTIQSDIDCPTPPAGYTRRLGLRYITNMGSLLSGCEPTTPPTPPTAPTLSSPTCFYYVDSAADPRTQLHRPDTVEMRPSAPGELRRWNVRLSTSRERDELFLTFQTYRDISTGGPCTPSSASCRSDIVGIFRPTNGFSLCGANGTCMITDASMTPLNGDTSLQGGSLLHRDHILPATVLADGRQVESSWLDFRNSTNNGTYQFISRYLRFPANIETPSESVESAPWSTPASGVFVRPVAPGFGDIDTAANGRLHAHFFHPQSDAPIPPYTSTLRPVTMIWAPQSPHE